MKNVGRAVFVSLSQSASVCQSIFGNSVRTAGPIGMGEALFDVFRPREDDGAYRESICGT